MHHAMKELPIVEDYGEGFCSRLVEWGGMINLPQGCRCDTFIQGSAGRHVSITALGLRFQGPDTPQAQGWRRRAENR
jgi:hypothetical protein